MIDLDSPSTRFWFRNHWVGCGLSVVGIAVIPWTSAVFAVGLVWMFVSDCGALVSLYRDKETRWLSVVAMVVSAVSLFIIGVVSWISPQ